MCRLKTFFITAKQTLIEDVIKNGIWNGWQKELKYGIVNLFMY